MEKPFQNMQRWKNRRRKKGMQICNNLVGRANYARHVRSCEQRNNVQKEREKPRIEDQIRLVHRLQERMYQREQYAHIAVQM